MRSFSKATLRHWLGARDPHQPETREYRDADDAAVSSMLDGVNARNWHASGFAVVARTLAAQMIPAPANTFATFTAATDLVATLRVYGFTASGDAMVYDSTVGRLASVFEVAGDGESVAVWTEGDRDLFTGEALTAETAAANIVASGDARISADFLTASRAKLARQMSEAGK